MHKTILRVAVSIVITSLLGIFLFGCSSLAPSEKRSAVQEVSTKTQTPLMTGLMAGSKAPNFTITTVDNKELTITSFSSNQKPVLLYFFATWCPYCKEDFGTLSSLYPQYEADVPILSIDLDLRENAKLIEAYHQNYPALQGLLFASGTMDVLSLYQIKYTTTKYAIGRDGKILYAGSGAFSEEQWKTLLDALKNS